MAGLNWSLQLFLLPVDSVSPGVSPFVRVLESLSRLSVVVLDVSPTPICLDVATELAKQTRCKLRVDPLWQGDEVPLTPEEVESFTHPIKAEFIPRDSLANRLEEAVKNTEADTRMVIVTRAVFQKVILHTTGTTDSQEMLLAQVDLEKSSLIFSARNRLEVDSFEPSHYILEDMPMVSSTIDLDFTPQSSHSPLDFALTESSIEIPLMPQKRNPLEIEITEKINHEFARSLCKPLSAFRQKLISTDGIEILTQAEAKLAALQARFTAIWTLLQEKISDVNQLKDGQNDTIMRLMGALQDITQTQDRIHLSLQELAHRLTTESEELKLEAEERILQGKQLAASLTAIQIKLRGKPFPIEICSVNQVEDGSVEMMILSRKHYPMWVRLEITGVDGSRKYEYKGVQCGQQKLTLMELMTGRYSVVIHNKEGNKTRSAAVSFDVVAAQRPMQQEQPDYRTSFLYQNIHNIAEVEAYFTHPDGLQLFQKVALCWTNPNIDMVETVMGTVLTHWQSGEAEVFGLLRDAGCSLLSS